MEPTKADIDRAQQRAYRYWYEDGLAELLTGGLYVLIGLIFFIDGLAPNSPPWVLVISLAFPIVVLGGWIVTGRAVRALKEKVTYPRTGFVQYNRPSPRHRRTAALVGAGMGMLVMLLVATSPRSLLWLPLLLGVSIGVLFLRMGYTVNLTRFYILASLSTLIGVLLAMGRLSDPWGSGLYFGCMGAVLLVSGGLTLRGYLHQTTPPAEGEQP